MSSLSAKQLTLNFEPGLAERHVRLIDCVRECIVSHPKPLKTIAADMDLSQSDLSRRMSHNEKDRRSFSLDDLENYIEATGDVTPIMYLIAKFMEPTEHKKARAIAELANLMPRIEAVLSQVQMEATTLKAVKP